MREDKIERLVGFDYRQVGPITLAKRKYRGLKETVGENLPWVIGAVVALTIAAWALGISLPTLPGWWWVGVAAGIAATIFFAPTSHYVAEELHNPDQVLLSEVNAKTGDQRILRVSRDRLGDMTVINKNGRVLDDGADALHDETINGTTAFECDRYVPDENVAVTSWQADTSNREIRRKKAEIDQIKTDLESEANRAIELLANHPAIVRDHAREIGNRVIAVAEGVETPQGGDLFSELDDMLDEVDPDESEVAGESAGIEIGEADGTTRDDLDVDALDGIEIDLSSSDDGGDGDDG